MSPRRGVVLAACLVALLPAVARAQTIGAANWPSERPPRPMAARPVAFPPYTLKTLPNGLQVVLVPWHEQPSVSMRLIIKAGAAQDPADKPGVASLVASLLDQGTSTKSSEAIANLVESAGGVIGVGAGNELSFVNAGVIKDKFDALMGLMSEVVQQPAFDPREIDRLKQQALSGMQVSYEDPDFVAGVVYERLVYGFHPYGKPPGGTLESLPKISRADLQAFHRTWFTPNNAILAIVGDLTADEMLAGAERAFGGWARRDVPAQTQMDPPPPTWRLVVVDKPGAVQTEIRAGQLTLPRTSPDWLKLELLTRILGGEGANRLFGVLRSERGLTYGASADLQTFKFAGGYVAQTNTRTETTGEALRLLVDEITRLTRERVDERELGGVQDYFAGSFPLTIETPSAIAIQVLNQLFYGLDLKSLEQMRDTVSQITPDELQAVARKWLKPDRLSIVLVGDAAKFTGQLRSLGFNDFERIPIGQLDLTATNLRKGGPAAGAAPAASAPAASPAIDPAAAALLTKVVAAKGGADALRAVKTIEAEADVTINEPRQAPVTMKTKNMVAYPDKFRVEASASGATLVQVVAGDEAWIETPAGTMAADPAARADFAASAARDVVTMLLAALDGRVPVEALPDTTVDGVAYPALVFRTEAAGPVVMLVDPKTSAVRALRYPSDPTPNAAQAHEWFEDYRPVNGVQVAFKARIERDGASISRALTRVVINGTLPATAFIRKGA